MYAPKDWSKRKYAMDQPLPEPSATADMASGKSSPVTICSTASTDSEKLSNAMPASSTPPITPAKSCTPRTEKMKRNSTSRAVIHPTSGSESRMASSSVRTDLTVRASLSTRSSRNVRSTLRAPPDTIVAGTLGSVGRLGRPETASSTSDTTTMRASNRLNPSAAYSRHPSPSSLAAISAANRKVRPALMLSSTKSSPAVRSYRSIASTTVFATIASMMSDAKTPDCTALFSHRTAAGLPSRYCSRCRRMRSARRMKIIAERSRVPACASNPPCDPGYEDTASGAAGAASVVAPTNGMLVRARRAPLEGGLPVAPLSPLARLALPARLLPAPRRLRTRGGSHRTGDGPAAAPARDAVPASDPDVVSAYG
mmetsp:Transcript_3993/g.16660  ORF Transcript_3993/g.16660 Transcript_3993/m.16660 type:complete len:369 (-) Transcript_3993:890-1996(-)